MNLIQVGVVVVAYRSAALIGQCLEGILADPQTRCVVVDNARDPATAKAVEDARTTSDGRVTYVDPGANLGYSRGCNLGVRNLPHDIDFVAIVNPDVRLEVALSQAATAADRSPNWTIISGCLSTGIPMGGCGNARPRATIGREMAKAVRGSRAYRQTVSVAPGGSLRVGQLDGALLLLRKSDWDSLGGFDGRFELYYEDVDICARANTLSGCWLVGQRWGYHEGGASFSVSGGRAFVALRVSRIRYLRKWFGARGVAMGALAALLEWVARTVGRCPESALDRAHALGASFAEVAHPGRVVVLEGGHR